MDFKLIQEKCPAYMKREGNQAPYCGIRQTVKTGVDSYSVISGPDAPQICSEDNCCLWHLYNIINNQVRNNVK